MVLFLTATVTLQKDCHLAEVSVTGVTNVCRPWASYPAVPCSVPFTEDS